MNLHEYQGKQLLEKFKVSIQKGYVANTPEEAVDCAKKLSNEKQSNINTNMPVANVFFEIFGCVNSQM